MLSSYVLTQSALAHVYRADVDEARWQVESSPLACRLSQPIPAYGKGVFAQPAGETQRFWLDSNKRVLISAEAQFYQATPEWHDQLPLQLVGSGSTTVGHRPVLALDPIAAQFLDMLEAGLFVQIDHPGWYTKHRVSIQVSSVNFTQAYIEYQRCLSGLYSHNFDQLERSTILFDTDKSNVRGKYDARLKLLEGYLKIDPTVKKIIVDGHTDEVGGDGYNWELSKNRAEAVAKRLKSLGVPEDQLEVRYHGERFPVARNTSAAKRQRNRRTTVRLERVGVLIEE